MARGRLSATTRDIYMQNSSVETTKGYMFSAKQDGKWHTRHRHRTPLHYPLRTLCHSTVTRHSTVDTVVACMSVCGVARVSQYSEPRHEAAAPRRPNVNAAVRARSVDSRTKTQEIHTKCKGLF